MVDLSDDMKTKTANKAVFKDLVSKLNEIGDSLDEAENILMDKLPASEYPTLIERPAPAKKPILNEDMGGDPAMQQILSNFNKIYNESVAPILLEEKTVGEFNLAVKTKVTNRGIQIGHWEIKKITEGKEIIYSIDNVDTKITILEDIRTYAAASAIVKLLNAGKAANCREVSTMLTLDESFRVNYQDAVHYRKKFLKTKNPIYEDRYEVCKGKALQLKEQLVRKADTLEIL